MSPVTRYRRLKFLNLTINTTADAHPFISDRIRSGKVVLVP
jgi:hypothetical protein